MSLPSPSSSTVVFFQDRCLSHRYMRSHDASLVFERPQRLRAVKMGVAAAIARLEQRKEEAMKGNTKDSSDSEDVLSTALERLNLAAGPTRITEIINVVMSTASVDLLNNPAVKYVHGDVDGDVYLEKLATLIRESEEKIARGESEIPEGLSQTDLYLCSQSLDAIQGAIGTVCEAVDSVIQTTRPCSMHESFQSGATRAFVAIRPPGHHCGEDTPSGFCFVNNVAVGAAHAHLKHGITRVVILDIDLHHGNGTQSIIWQINEESYRQQSLPESTGTAPNLRPLQVYYGSIHDPLSYPCEDGNAAIVQAASMSLHGPHGQHVENVHLLPYNSEADFWDRLYYGPYARLLQKAEEFLEASKEDEAIIFISAGFDASEHETASMSRHGRKLPTGFFRKFARDVRIISDKYAKGRIISVLEGGYSDRALCSGAMAHVLGLAEEDAEVNESWWSVENLAKIEKLTKKRRGGRSSTSISVASDNWVERTVSLLSIFDPNPSPPSTPKPIPPSTMTLRNRSKADSTVSPSPNESGTSPLQSRSNVEAGKGGRKSAIGRLGKDAAGDHPATKETILAEKVSEEVKKLPRVLLRVNPPVETNHPQG